MLLKLGLKLYCYCDYIVHFVRQIINSLIDIVDHDDVNNVPSLVKLIPFYLTPAAGMEWWRNIMGLYLEIFSLYLIFIIIVMEHINLVLMVDEDDNLNGRNGSLVLMMVMTMMMMMSFGYLIEYFLFWFKITFELFSFDFLNFSFAIWLLRNNQ